jgi:putative FmdB family regulatory protein
MPTYEYRCKDCGHTFDAYQSFTDDALTECPQCGGLVKKVFGNVGIAFKGSGFYKTDSRSGSTSTSSSSSSANGGSEKKDAAASSTSSSSDSSSSGSSSSGSDSSSGKKESSTGSTGS